jgi:hypothetical protein
LREIAEREPHIESVWVRDDAAPQPWGTRIYSLVETHGDFIEARVCSFDVIREGFAPDHRCIYDKLP